MNNEDKPIPPLPAWTKAADAIGVAVALGVLLLQDLRGPLVITVLCVPFFLAYGVRLRRDWRAGLLRMPLREAARRAQPKSFTANTFELMASVLFVVAFVTLSLRR